MKKWYIVGFLGIMMSSFAQAEVVDKLRCILTLTDTATSKTISSLQNIALMRIRDDRSASDRAITTATTSFKIDILEQNYVISAKADLQFHHAVRYDETGRNVVDSRQATCNTIAGDFCRKGGQECYETINLCGIGDDPFDVALGWQKVTLIEQTRIPQFDSQPIADVIYKIQDTEGVHGVVNLNCTFLVTEYDAVAPASIN